MWRQLEEFYLLTHALCFHLCIRHYGFSHIRSSNRNGEKKNASEEATLMHRAFLLQHKSHFTFLLAYKIEKKGGILKSKVIKIIVTAVQLNVYLLLGRLCLFTPAPIVNRPHNDSGFHRCNSTSRRLVPIFMSNSTNSSSETEQPTRKRT